jgi:hypothetical protein
MPAAHLEWNENWSWCDVDQVVQRGRGRGHASSLPVVTTAMPVSGIAQFERFFRAATSLGVDKEDLNACSRPGGRDADGGTGGRSRPFP